MEDEHRQIRIPINARATTTTTRTAVAAAASSSATQEELERTNHELMIRCAVSSSTDTLTTNNNALFFKQWQQHQQQQQQQQQPQGVPVQSRKPLRRSVARSWSLLQLGTMILYLVTFSSLLLSSSGVDGKRRHRGQVLPIDGRGEGRGGPGGGHRHGGGGGSGIKGEHTEEKKASGRTADKETIKTTVVVSSLRLVNLLINRLDNGKHLLNFLA